MQINLKTGQGENYVLVSIKSLLMIKLITCIILAFSMPVVASNSFAQEKVSLRLSDASLKDIIKSIEKQTSVKFVYLDNLITDHHIESIEVSNKPWTEVLMPVLRKSGLTIRPMDKNQVVISPIERKQQDYTVRGNVVNSEGIPLSGVSVVERDSPRGTSTDEYGAFEIKISGANAVLEISYIGYITKTVLANSVNENIVLEEDLAFLDEVVVVGFGTQKKVNLTGAVQSISSKDLQDRPVTNTSSAIQGKFAGVTVTQNSGQPGKDGGTIRIRGLGTINNANPLVIVDGIESSMNNINPNDIENISVLKDGPSAAIYGSKAANGVILITTKRGKVGKPQLTYSGYAGWQDPTRLPKYMESYDHAFLLNEALINEGSTPRFSQTDLDGFKAGTDLDKYPNTDWQDLLYQGSGFQQTHNFQVSGATETMNYMASAGWLEQEGVIKVASSDRYNLRTNIGAKVGDRLKLDMGLAYNYQKIAEPLNPYTSDMAQIFRQVNRIPSFIPYQYSNGYYGYYSDGNPIAWLDMQSIDNMTYKHTQINLSGEFEILKGLKFKQVVGFQPIDNVSSKFVKKIQYYDNETGKPTSSQGPTKLTVDNFQTERLTLQSLLTYDKSFGNHNFNALAGFMDETFRADFTKAYRQNFLSTDLSELDLGDPDGQQANGGAKNLILRSWFGRINYAFADKYLLEVNVRHDGTSRFIGKNRWSTFPSFSGGWRISQESFFQNSGLANVFSEVKLRGGWGKLGNQQLAATADNSYPLDDKYYPGLFYISPQNYSFGGKLQSGGAITDSANPLLKWESTTSMNIGLDLDLHKNWSFVVDYFDRKTDGVLLQLPVSSLYGLPAPVVNAGTVQNNGVELQINYRNNVGDFAYSIGANGTYINNKIKKWASNAAEPYGDFYVYQQGLPIRAFYGYETVGIYRSDDEYKNSGVKGVTNNVGAGDLIYKDQNGDNKIDGNDRVYLGSPDPKYVFGLTANASYKNFEMSVFFQGAADVKGYMWGEAIGGISASEKPTTIYSDRFHPDLNPNGTMPRALTSWSQNSPSSNPSDFWLKNASYLRMKNITIGYNLPQSFLNRVGIKGAKVYYSGQNLFTITSFLDGFDPEAPAGNRGNYYPQVKTNVFGLNVNF